MAQLRWVRIPHISHNVPNTQYTYQIISPFTSVYLVWSSVSVTGKMS